MFKQGNQGNVISDSGLRAKVEGLHFIIHTRGDNTVINTYDIAYDLKTKQFNIVDNIRNKSFGYFKYINKTTISGYVYAESVAKKYIFKSANCKNSIVLRIEGVENEEYNQAFGSARYRRKK